MTEDWETIGVPKIACVSDLIAALRDCPPEATVYSWIGNPIDGIQITDEGVLLMEDAGDT